MPDIVARLRAAGCVFAEDEAALLRSSAASEAELEHLVRRRVSGEPLEYVVGWAQFRGRHVLVDPGVFIPRRRTEFLVEVALELLDAAGAPSVVVDLCCGAGAIGAALLAESPQIDLHAVDIDPRAVRCAGRNLGEQRVYEGDLYDPLPHRLRGTVRLVVANTPYVPTADIRLLPREARLHEPRTTLDGGPDGLDVQRLVAAGAGAWLTPGGHVLVESSAEQAPQTARIFSAIGLAPRIEVCDEFDATIVVGTLPG